MRIRVLRRFARAIREQNGDDDGNERDNGKCEQSTWIHLEVPLAGVRSSGATCLELASARGCENDRTDRNQYRNEQDVPEFERRAEALDFDIQTAAHVAQLFADAHALLLEAVDLSFLLWRE